MHRNQYQGMIRISDKLGLFRTTYQCLLQLYILFWDQPNQFSLHYFDFVFFRNKFFFLPESAPYIYNDCFKGINRVGCWVYFEADHKIVKFLEIFDVGLEEAKSLSQLRLYSIFWAVFSMVIVALNQIAKFRRNRNFNF